MKTILRTNYIKSLGLAVLGLFFGTAWGQATLPVNRTSWGTEPQGWTNNGCAHRTTSSACSNNSATTFDGTGDNRILFINAAPQTLSMTLKNQGMSGQSYLLVEQSADGSDYTELGRYGTANGATSITNAQCSDIDLPLLSSTRYIRWTYTKASGNCDMDDVIVTAAPVVPAFTVSSTSITSFGNVNIGASSNSSSVTIAGTNLTGNITATAPTNFQVSTNNSTWSSSVSYTPASGTVTSRPLYVRFTPLSTGLKSGSITVSTSGASNQNISVSGTGVITSTTWNGSAWSNGNPTATIDAVISGNYNTNTAAPQGPIVSKNLSITSGTVIIGVNGLNVKETLSKTGGTIDATAGDITFSGTAAQTLPANFFVNNTVEKLILNNAAGLTLGGTTNLTGVLDVVSGNLATNGNLVLKSTASGSARIPAVTGSITGEVTVERYIPQGKRAFRFLTPGVTTTNFISNNWQTGTHITGSDSGANGFDTTLTGNPSMYVYNNNTASGSGWSAIANTDATNLVAGNGYRILIRGDRNVDLGQSSAANMNAAVTLTAKGTLKTGQVVFDAATTPAINATENATTNGYSLIGNPYVSPVDWHSVTKSGVEDVYYAWDPNMGTAAQRGRYVAYSQTVGSNNLPESAVNQYIQPGQAFFVKNTVLGTAGAVTFNESNKASQSANVFRTNSTEEKSVFRIAVYDANETEAGYPIDGTIAVFGSNYDNAIGLGDVEKLYGSGEHLAFGRNSKILAIDALAPVMANDELQVKTLQFTAGKTYTFKINAANFPEDMQAFLIDQYANTETQLNLSGVNSVNFTTTSDANSYSSDRFRVVFRSAALGNGEWNNNTVKVYPNPIQNNQFNIALPNNVAGKVAITLYNLVGQEIYKTNVESSNIITVNPSLQLSKGIYILQISNGTASVKQKIAVK